MQINSTEQARLEAAHPVQRGIALKAQGLQKSFGGQPVLRGVDLTIKAGEFIVVVGRSGCGKSTLLRLLAGLESPDSGTLRFEDRDVDVFPETRVMFQDSRLLPWKRVDENVALGLPKGASVGPILRQVGLENRAGEWPAVLSGGQRQRVALARALVHDPQLLLLDEPLGALDALTRIEMQQMIENLWLMRKFTALLVTHDVQEAVALADRVVLIQDGRIELDCQIDLPRPRLRSNPRLAELEEQILSRVLRPTTVHAA